MKILIIRHGDPNYEIDGLTSIGKKEAHALVPRMMSERIEAIYCSPLGRARRTAEPTEIGLGLNCEIKHWLREFNHVKVKLPYLDSESGCWDLLPEFVDEHPELYDPKGWLDVDFIKNSEIPSEYNRVCRGLDELLSEHGYVRDGLNYRAERPNHGTIALFCHYGVTAVILSHLMNCSPYSLWQNTVTLPASVTTVYTEERREGKALMRIAGIGDVSHLSTLGLEPSFSARFCECFTDDTRHD